VDNGLFLEESAGRRDSALWVKVFFKFSILEI